MCNSASARSELGVKLAAMSMARSGSSRLWAGCGRGSSCARRPSRAFDAVASHELAGQLEICLGATGARIVKRHRLAVAGRFGQAHVARNHCFDKAGRGSIRAGSRSPAGPDWCGRRTWSAARLRSSTSGLKAARTRSRVEISSETPSRAKYSACMGTISDLGRGQDVERQQVERRRAVEDDQVVFVPDGAEGVCAGAGRGRRQRRARYWRRSGSLSPGSSERVSISVGRMTWSAGARPMSTS